MSAMGVTRKQHEALTFINERIRESGVAPSFDEIKDALDLKSKSGVHRLMTALEDRGFLRRMEKRARAIEVLRLPGDTAENRRPAVSRDQQRRGYSAVRSPVSVSGAVKVPVVGKIASVGTPIEALQNRIYDAEVSSALLGRGNHYALEVVGDAMVNAGIIDGDLVIIQESDTGNSGDILIMMVDQSIVYLRRYRRRGDCTAMEAYNPAYETRLYSPGRVAIKGRLVGLVRRY